MFEEGLEEQAEGGALAGAGDAGALEEEAHGAAFVDGDDLHIAAVCHQGGADLVQRQLDLVAQVLRHPDVHGFFIGDSRACVESPKSPG